MDVTAVPGSAPPGTADSRLLKESKRRARIDPELVNADFVITDSGGLQQELAILGIPTLIHRRATETKDGLGENIVLSEWDSEIVRNFVQNRSSYRRDQISLKYSPSEIAAHAIKDWISLE